MQVIFACMGFSAQMEILTIKNQHQSTQWVAMAVYMCNGKNYCTGVVSIQILGEPYPGCCKDFLGSSRVF